MLHSNEYLFSLKKLLKIDAIYINDKTKEKLTKYKKTVKVKEFPNLRKLLEKRLDKGKKIYYNSRPISEERLKKRVTRVSMRWEIFNNLEGL